MEEIVIRQYQDSDKDQVKNLHRLALEATGAFYKSGKWDGDLDKIPETYLQGGDFLVGFMDDRLIAMGALKRISKRVGEIKRMRVIPELQGQGIGRTMLERLEERARQLGFTTLQLDTTIKQVVAQKLYERTGYVEIRRGIEGWPLETIFYKKEL